MKDKRESTYGMMGYCIKMMFKMDKTYLLLLSVSMAVASVVPFINANLVSEVINLATTNARVDKAILAAAIMLGILTILQVIDIYVRWYRTNHYIDMGHHFDTMVGRKTFDMKYEKAENPEISELRLRAGKGCSAVPVITEYITDFGSNIIKIVSCATIFTMFNPLILLVIIPFAALNYFTSKYFQNKYYENEKMEHKPRRKINYFLGNMLDYVAGKEIRVFGAADFMKDKYLEQEKEVYDIRKKKHGYTLIDRMCGVVIVVIQLIILYLLVGREYFKGYAMIGDVTLYINLVLVFSGAFAGLFESYAAATAKGERLKDFKAYMAIEDEDELIEVEEMEPVIKTIEFEHVWFKYQGAEDYVLKDVSLKLTGGQKIAVVGENGSGKTTFIKLLMRFYTPTKGRILVNGVDYLTIKRYDYYRLFSTVFQDFNLFAFSIRENIVFTEDSSCDERMIDELKKLDMYDKINKLTSGLNTYVTQEYAKDGVNFSGGERQKLAIARAACKDAPMLILDEPTSALDPIAENKLYDELYNIMKDKTMIMISHRLQSTAICDYILFIKNGEIAEEGNHEALINNGGDYCHMYELQAGWYK
ncbi:MAG: ABC transporter ATP-binding protein [Lachnospiraceae bacterium]|nr:ABC transporter ATP-binding protein [Lachnospiraceae bacterium]